MSVVRYVYYFCLAYLLFFIVNYFLGVDGTPLDFDLTDIDIEFEEETEEVKKEINIIPRLLWTKEQVI